MSETLIKVEGVSKKFCKDLKRSLWYGVKDIGSSLMGAAPEQGLRKGEFWAVRDVSFEVKRGECLGLIGHNGAGKSTLLKMLNGLIRPDKGRIEMRGKIGALIELGAGFNPVLTGRENVYNNGAVLGFSKAEIDRKFDDIVAFAELEEFIDMPVQNYSSGMKVRLGFAVASQMEPDILLVDEVLAVGDVGFKIKCYNEIYRMMKSSAVIFVSHSMPQVAKVCTRAILLDHGKIVYSSNQVGLVTNEYFNLFKNSRPSIEGSQKGQVLLLNIQNENKVVNLLESENLPFMVEYREILKINFGFASDNCEDDILLMFSIEDIDQKMIAQYTLGPTKGNIQNKEVALDLEILNAGKYYVSIFIFDFRNDQRGDILFGFRSIIHISVNKKLFLGPAPIAQTLPL